MKLLEVPHEGKVYGYIVGQGGVLSISKKGTKVIVTVEHAELGSYETTFDLSKFSMYTIG